jgi:hypothetical protein
VERDSRDARSDSAEAEPTDNEDESEDKLTEAERAFLDLLVDLALSRLDD